MNEMGEGPVLIGVGKPEPAAKIVGETPAVLGKVVEPDLKANQDMVKKIESDIKSPTTQLADAVAEVSTIDQLKNVIKEYIKEHFDLAWTEGKAVLGAAVPELAVAMRGINILENNVKPKKPIRSQLVEGIRLDPNSTLLTPEQPFKDSTKRLTMEKILKGHKEGQKDADSTKARAREQAVFKVAKSLGLDNPYPHVPDILTFGSDVAAIFGVEGVQFVPLAIEDAIIKFKQAKAGVNMLKKMYEIAKNRPKDERTFIGNVTLIPKVALSLVAEKIENMKKPKSKQAAAAFVAA